MDVRFELTTNDPWSVDDAICEGISPLGYWQKVNQSTTQTKPYNTLPPFEQRDSWSSYRAVRAYSEVLYNLGDPGRVICQVLDMRKYTFLQKAFSWWT